MRVLQVIAEMVSGGAEAVVEELALGLPSLGHQVGVASAGGRREQVVRAAGAQLYPVPLAGRSLPGPVRTATAQRRAARQFHPDVLHAHNVVVAATAHLGVRLLRRRPPMLVTFHGVPAARYARAAQVLDAVADGVVVVAPSVGDSLRAAGLHRVPVVVVPNAVSPPDVGDRTAARAAVRTELGLAEDTPVAVCVARLVPQKRHDVLVDALALADPRLVVLAVGTGPDLDAVAARAAAAGLGDRLRLLGERADVPRLLAAADQFVLSSDWEGLPMAVLEAMSLGLPVVATAVDGLVEACAASALLVPRRDPVALAAALSRVVAEPSLGAALGRAGQDRIATHHSPSGMVAAYATLYDQLLRGATLETPSRPETKDPR